MQGRFPLSLWLRILTCGAFALLVAIVARPGSGQNRPDLQQDLEQPIRISGRISHFWQNPDGSQVSIIRGACRIEQGDLNATAGQIVVWQTPFEGSDRVEVFFDEQVTVNEPGVTRRHNTLLQDFWTQGGVEYFVQKPNQRSGPVADALFVNASKQRHFATIDNPIQPAQHIELPPPGQLFTTHRLESSASPVRRVRIYARTGQDFSFRTEESTLTTPPEQIGIISGGVKIAFDSPSPDGSPDPNAIELAADSMVVWAQATNLTDLFTSREQFEPGENPIQIYLEGNIVIRQQNQILRAERGFYDASENRALLTNAELKYFLESAQTYIRVRASSIRQLSEKNFHAQNAWISPSYFGKPGYRFEASDVYLESRTVDPVLKAQGGRINPRTGKFESGDADWLTSLNNRVMLGDLPIFYLPHASARAEIPTIPLRRADFRSDSVFGTQFRTAWDPYRLFQRDAPADFTTSLLLDYYSRRGPGGGLEGAYDRDDVFGMGDRGHGEFLGFYVNDGSEDNLGLDRRSVVPRDESRGRLFWRHRHEFPSDLSVFLESGYVSDRNFLEQWYENEFDRDKDNDTRVSIEQMYDNVTWSLLGQPLVNGFENQTEWYPKGDLFVLGEPVLGSPVTWWSHSSAGYANLHAADRPTDPTDVFTPLPYYSNVSGQVLMSRHELTLPFSLGPVVLSPFVMGEAANWGSDLFGQSINRLVGSAGLQGSMSMWRVFPNVRSSILNLNGLAHKMIFDFEYSYTDSSEDITRIAQFNSFDDDAQERFRQRFPTNTFGGAVPGVLEPRRYAIRTGAGSLVSVPYHELVDDLQVVRLGWRHRLQTKVGAPGDTHIRDWMTLDLEASFFPRAGHHSLSGADFGEDFGLLSARYSWLLSERTALLANTLYDTFDGGQQIWNVGLLSQRNARGSVYAGVRQIKATGVNSQIATGSVSYLMSDKWATTASTAYDLAEGMNRGQTMTLTRIGADFLFHTGFSYDRSRDNVGVAISLEPRFGPRTPYSSQMGSLLGLDQR